MNVQEGEQKEFTGENRRAPYHIVNGEITTDPSFRIAREVYPLEKYEFDKVLNGKSVWLQWANFSSAAFAALLLNMLGKAIGNQVDPENVSFDPWELYSAGFSLVLLVVLYSINFCVSNTRRKIIKKIHEHFKE